MQNETEFCIFPFLTVHDAAYAAKFYVEVFGGIEKERFTNDGKIMARIDIGKTGFWVGDEEPEFNNFSPVKFGGSPVRIVLTTQNPETIFNKALESGAKEICPVTVEDSWKIGKLQDPFGHIWEIGCPI